MTNAERQKRYRDRQRGGPPVGRWQGHLSTAKIAKAQHISRTMVFMARWVMKHAPDLVQALESGELKMAPTYRRLRGQYIMAMAKALESKHGRNAQLIETRHAGQFVFKWKPGNK
jgi:hypothetical protein